MTGTARTVLLVVAAVAAAATAGAVLAGPGGRAQFAASIGAKASQAGWDDAAPSAESAHTWCGHGASGPLLRPRHSLFARPGMCGGARAAVSQAGWAWFADPPSEEGL